MQLLLRDLLGQQPPISAEVEGNVANLLVGVGLSVELNDYVSVVITL